MRPLAKTRANIHCQKADGPFSYIAQYSKAHITVVGWGFDDAGDFYRIEIPADQYTERLEGKTLKLKKRVMDKLEKIKALIEFLDQSQTLKVLNELILMETSLNAEIAKAQSIPAQPGITDNTKSKSKNIGK